MEQVIDGKKLYKWIKAEINPYGKPFEGTVFEFGNKVMEHIEAMENQPQVVCSRREWYQKGYQDGLNADKWIPCKERLPSEEMSVWVTHENGKVLEHYWYRGEFVNNYPLDEPRPYPKAIAWQPKIKPQPYKKEGAE